MNRENVCYCIRIDSNGNLAQTYSQIEDSIDKRSIIEIVVSHVYKDVLKGLYHNVGIYIPKYEAIIIGRKHQKYIVILKDLWIEGFLESSKKYNNGDELIVWMTAYGTQYAYFIE